MLKKLLSAFLALMILTAASSLSVFARANGGDEEKDKKAAPAAQEKQTEKTGRKNWSAIVKSESDPADLEFTNKQTRREYEKLKAEGKKFSTTTKVLIGVGIAAAVIVVVAVLANKGARDAASF